MISSEIPNKLIEKGSIIPYSNQDLVSILHEYSKVIKEYYIEEGTCIKSLGS